MWLSSQVQLCSAPQDLVYCRPSHILCGWDQGLASDLDIFSAPLSRGFLVVSISLVKTGGSQIPPELYTCIFHTHSYWSCNREVFLQFLVLGQFFWTEVKIMPLPENCPISIGLALLLLFVQLVFTHSLCLLVMRSSRVLYKLKIRQTVLYLFSVKSGWLFNLHWYGQFPPAFGAKPHHHLGLYCRSHTYGHRYSDALMG